MCLIIKPLGWPPMVGKREQIKTGVRSLIFLDFGLNSLFSVVAIF